MKKQILLFAATILLSATAFPQWTQKANFGGTARYGATGFSIGTKGYITTGIDASSIYNNDLWEWDQPTNTWTQLTNFPGPGRRHAVAFTIGTKTYVGTGYDGTNYYKDFYVWDQISNTWTQIADFGGTARYGAISFSINGKGYVGTGKDASAMKNDFWEYNPTADTLGGTPWTQKTNFGGTARTRAVAFSVGTKGYVGTGYNGTNYYKDFWEYNPTADTSGGAPWTQKTNFGGTARRSAVGFSMGTKGYIGTGYDGNNNNDFWGYDPTADTLGGTPWTQKTNFGGSVRHCAIGFAIDTLCYIGTGIGASFMNDFWEYNLLDVYISEITDNSEIKIFPNPATDIIEILTPLKEDIEILNIQGQHIKSISTTGNKTSIDVSGLSNGMYFLKINTNNGIVVKRFIKQ